MPINRQLTSQPDIQIAVRQLDDEITSLKRQIANMQATLNSLSGTSSKTNAGNGTSSGGSGGSAPVTFSGDISGSNTDQTVIGLQTIPISTTAPLNNQVLEFDGSNWTPTTLPAGQNITFAGDISGSDTSQTVTGIQNKPISTTAPTNNQVLGYNGSTWTPSNLPTIPPAISFGGDLSGTNSSQKVTGLQGIPINPVGPLNNQILTYTSGSWIPSSGAQLNSLSVSGTSILAATTVNGIFTTNSTSNLNGNVTLTGNLSATGSVTAPNSVIDGGAVIINSSDGSSNFQIGPIPNNATNIPVYSSAPILFSPSIGSMGAIYNVGQNIVVYSSDQSQYLNLVCPGNPALGDPNPYIDSSTGMVDFPNSIDVKGTLNAPTIVSTNISVQNIAANGGDGYAHIVNWLKSVETVCNGNMTIAQACYATSFNVHSEIKSLADLRMGLLNPHKSKDIHNNDVESNIQLGGWNFMVQDDGLHILGKKSETEVYETVLPWTHITTQNSGNLETKVI